ncbi:unnamed protein product, partial [Ectocarpus sp. 12 AP-2014]
ADWSIPSGRAAGTLQYHPRETHQYSCPRPNRAHQAKHHPHHRIDHRRSLLLMIHPHLYRIAWHYHSSLLCSKRVYICTALSKLTLSAGRCNSDIDPFLAHPNIYT